MADDVWDYSQLDVLYVRREILLSVAHRGINPKEPKRASRGGLPVHHRTDQHTGIPGPNIAFGLGEDSGCCEVFLEFPAISDGFKVAAHGAILAAENLSGGHPYRGRMLTPPVRVTAG